MLPHSHSLSYVIPHNPHFFISSSFLFYSSTHALFFSFSLSSHFITSHFISSISLSPLSHTIHLFILTTFHAFSHHLIYITLITSHINLSFIPHHPHSILLPFHHFRIFHFSTHPFHHGALRHFLKTHFHPFHLASYSIHYSNLLSFLFHLHHLHHHISLLFITIRIYVLYSFISIPFFLSATSITLTPIHFHSIPLIPFHFIIFIQLLSLFWLLILKCSVVYSPFIIPPSLSSHPFLFSFLSFPSYTCHSSFFFASYLRVSTMRSITCLLTHIHKVCW